MAWQVVLAVVMVVGQTIWLGLHFRCLDCQILKLRKDIMTELQDDTAAIEAVVATLGTVVTQIGAVATLVQNLEAGSVSADDLAGLKTAVTDLQNAGSAASSTISQIK